MPANTASTPRGEAAPVAAGAECHHHWMIDAPNGPISVGHCKLCGGERQFPNSSEDSIGDGAEGRSRWNDMGISRRRRTGGSAEPQESVAVV